MKTAPEAEEALVADDFPRRVPARRSRVLFATALARTRVGRAAATGGNGNTGADCAVDGLSLLHVVLHVLF